MAWQFSSENAEDALGSRDEFVAAFVEHARGRVDEFVAKMIFTEAVANVVRHAPGPIHVVLESSADAHWLCVYDRGPAFEWSPDLPTDPYHEGGRGLFLIDRYAEQTILERVADGNAVRIKFKPME